MNRRSFLESAALATVYALGGRATTGRAEKFAESRGQEILIRPAVEKGALPHFWEECVGSDRAVVGLREQWLLDLELVHKETGMKSVRFHGLFNDEMGVWPAGAKEPNFLYVDTIFDEMLARGVKPFVELSFMPGGLASGTRTALFYHGNVTIPKDMAQWMELVRRLAGHCIDRYGIEEVSTWRFEVCNEPNLPFFWAGTQAEYFELYRQGVTALKSVDKRLRAGGPSTAQAAWVADLLEFCSSQSVPIDFVSTHVYPDDSQKKVFGEGVQYPFEEVIPRALQKIDSQIKASSFPSLPLYLTEWSSQNPAFIAHTTKSCIGLAEVMSYWTFDNVYEELGVPKSFLNSSFGLIGTRGVPRPSFHTYTLLHKLGSTQLQSDEGPVLATRREDGSVAILAWNLIPRTPGEHSSTGDPTLQVASQYSNEGGTKEFVLRLEGSRHKKAKGHISRVDQNSGDIRQAYKDMGSPPYPTVLQIEELRRRSVISKPESVALSPEGEVRITIPPNGVVLLELA